MAYYKYPSFVEKKDFLHPDRSGYSIFDIVYSPGKTVPFSGIYRCETCSREAACNQGDPFPSHHPSCGDIKWRLIVVTNNYE